MASCINKVSYRIVSIRYANILFGNYFLKCYIVKRILTSFNCFSEYITKIISWVDIHCSGLCALFSFRFQYSDWLIFYY